MPIPIAPIAGVVLRYGAVALATYAASRAIQPGRLDQRVEDAMDEIAEGVSLRNADEQVNAAMRWKRTLRMTRSGKGIEVDAIGMGRIRVRRVS